MKSGKKNFATKGILLSSKRKVKAKDMIKKNCMIILNYKKNYIKWKRNSYTNQDNVPNQNEFIIAVENLKQ